METKQIGTISEYKIIARLLELGASVSIPVGDNERFDIIIYYNNVFYRAQCKTGRIRNGCVVAGIKRTRHNNCGNYTDSYSCDEIDVILIYCPDNNQTYWINISDFSINNQIRKKVALRVEETKNNQNFGVVWAKDHIL